MPSLVPDFIINPVLRQARRLSNFGVAENEAAAAFSSDDEDSDDPRRPSSSTSSLPPNAVPFADDASPGSDAKRALHNDRMAGLVWPVTRLFGRRDFDAEVSEQAETQAVPIPAARGNNTTLPHHFRAASLPQLDEIDGASIAISSSAPQEQPSQQTLSLGPDPGNHSSQEEPTPSTAAAAADGTQGVGTGSLPAAFFGNMELPEDDGMTALRKRILAIQHTDALPPEKARLMHGLLMEGYTRSRSARLPLRPVTPSSPRPTEVKTSASSTPSREQGSSVFPSSSAVSGPLEHLKFWHHNRSFTPPPAKESFILSDDDVRPTYVPGVFVPILDDEESKGGPVIRAANGNGDYELQRPVLGCEHYRRKIKMQCSICERWYTCRLCHDEAEDHVLPRRETKHMLCMLCGHPQGVSDTCTNCGAMAARYYCNICKLWDDDPDTHIYHCNDCGICRVGEGLGKDFFHCKKCGSCIAIHQEDSHRCREGVMDCDCPICGEYLFTSHRKVVTMKCGHTIHNDCRAEYIKRSYKCPICNKSVENMESMFRRLDKHLAEQPMPEEYKDTRAIILCNDCEAKTSTKYHWGGLRCEVCLSYNTVELLLLNSPKSHNQPSQGHERSASGATEGDGFHGAALRTGAFGLPLAVSADAPGSTPTSPPMSSSPMTDRLRATARSPPLMTFRSASPAYMTSPATAPVIATAPPGYTSEGFQLDQYEGQSQTENEDILGLWGTEGHRFRTSHFKNDDDHADNDDDESESDESDSTEENPEDEDDEDDDEDAEDPIPLIGHR